MAKKIKIGVIMGGMSVEKEVSFNSGRTVCDHLDKQRFDVIPLFQKDTGELYNIPQKFLYRGKISDFEERLDTQAQRISWDDLTQLIDIAFIAQHGRFGEDGCLQGILELARIPYIGSKVTASAIGMNKAIQKIFLNINGICTPRGICLQPHQLHTLTQAQLDHAGLTFPLIVKPANEGSSFGVKVAHTLPQLCDAARYASTINNQLQSVLIEEKINGMEFSCIVVQHPETNEFQALSVTEITQAEPDAIFDYEQKYMPGRAIKWTPARCSAEQLEHIQQTCAATASALGFCTLGRIDGFLTPTGTVVIIDPNTLSGLAPSSFAFVQAAQKKLNHTQFLTTLIDTEMKKITPSPHRPAALEHMAHTVIKQPHKKTVAVIFGGASHEREISLESGRNVIYKLPTEYYQVIPLFMHEDHGLYQVTHEQLVLNSTHEIAASLLAQQRWSLEDLQRHANFVFIALHGGVGENGTLQGALEMLKIPYNGSGVLASAICMDKHKTIQLLKASGFHAPHNILIPCILSETERDEVLYREIHENNLSYPLIVKPHNDGCSVGVHKVDTQTQLHAVLDALRVAGHTHALVEEFITGMELTVGVLGNNHPVALPPSAAIALQGILSIEEKFLPGAGENQTPAPLPEQTLLFIQQEIEKIYQTVGCAGYARIDCFYQSPEQSPTGSQRIVTIEINSLPGLTPATVIFHQAAEVGMSPSEFLHKIVEFGLEKHAKLQHVEPLDVEAQKQEVALA